MLRKQASKNGTPNAAVFQTTFPLQQYSKALQGLQKLLSSDHVQMDLVLICSMAFIHFEAFRECFVPALVHAENVIRLLHSSTKFDASSVDPSLVRAMMRIDIQGTMYLGKRIPALSFYTSATNTVVPLTFHDLTQARDLINTWTCRLYHFMRAEADHYRFRSPGDVPLEVLAKSQDMEQNFVKMDRLLWDLMQRPDIRMTTREHNGLAMLRIRVKINRIYAATCLYAEATLYDRYIDEFESILGICEGVESSDDADRRIFSASLDEDLPHPLYFTASSCRDSFIRHQALRLLKKLLARAGTWLVEVMTREAELCVNFEEELCDKTSPKCEDIPEWRRVHSAGYIGTAVAANNMTAHLRVRPNGMDGGWADVEQLMEL